MGFATVQRLLRHDAASGVVLMLGAAFALVLANSPFAALYDLLLGLHASVRIGNLGIDKPLLLWVNDGLMAIFFLLVGLEIKREAIEGELSDRRRAVLPVLAALGGMVVPALIYIAIALREPGALAGWAIPCATDIAFSLGVMALLGSRVATLAQALSDRAGDHRRPRLDRDHRGLLHRASFPGCRWAAQRRRSPFCWRSTAPAFGACRVVRADRDRAVGVRAEIGRACDPRRRRSGAGDPVSGRTRRGLAAGSARARASAMGGVRHRAVVRLCQCRAFLRRPVVLVSILEPIPLGIAAGLFLGKQIGVFGSAALAIRLGWAERRSDASWPASMAPAS